VAWKSYRDRRALPLIVLLSGVTALAACSALTAPKQPQAHQAAVTPSVTVGAWGSDVTMTPSVVAVRQNLYPLVAGGRPTALAGTRRWRAWGGTCPCGAGQHGAEHQWRSGLGVTADGALVYVTGPKLDPLQLAWLLVRAGAVRGMQLDINPTWPVFASFKPAAPDGPAAPSNGTRLIATYRGPATFFDPAYARDFITMSARQVTGSH
jgi:hypothetical protein